MNVTWNASNRKFNLFQTGSKSPTTLEEARNVVEEFVRHYNKKRLHSDIGYIAPHDKLDGKENAIFQQRKEKLKIAKNKRAKKLCSNTAKIVVNY